MRANRSSLRILSHHRLYDLIRAHPGHRRRTISDGGQEFWDDFIFSAILPGLADLRDPVPSRPCSRCVGCPAFIDSSDLGISVK